MFPIRYVIYNIILMNLILNMTITSAFVNMVNSSNLEKYFVIALKNVNIENVINLAKENNYNLIGEVRGFKNIFLFEKSSYNPNNNKRSYFQKLSPTFDERILWTSQQKLLKRDKRDLIYFSLDEYFPNDMDNMRIDYEPVFNDELWEKQWYMDPLNKTKNDILDLNVLPVYAKGITGKNVRIAVLDDGLEYDHEDLIDNYDPKISWDCNNDVPDPYPSYTGIINNRHGTRCAGEIAMIANNKKCGVGIAFNARIGGIKLLNGEVFDLIEGIALGFAYDKIDIYSSSWGPTDDGMKLEKPGLLALYAFKRGVTEGRNGLGNIYVWASGNGGSKNDNCNCDGYAALIYTITVGSVTQRGNIPWYSERCASIMTVTHSSGSQKDQMITTTDLKNSCTTKHTGTSASAPLAAGIIALGLEANPKLTWRDVQHIIVQTSEYLPLKHNKGWQINGAGYPYNVALGFGLMNADAFVTKALNWKNVPKKNIEQIQGVILSLENSTILRTSVAFNYRSNLIEYLEHVEVNVNIISPIRGNLEIFLKSPQGTYTPILHARKNDKSTEGFIDWKFMSVATWYENPNGKWEMEIIDRITPTNKNFIRIGNCTLILHGTYRDPYNG